MEDNIAKLREQYFQAIGELQDQNDIINALPKVDYVNFFPIIKGLIELLENQYKDFQEMLAMEEKGSEMYEYICEDLELCNMKKNLCIKLLVQGDEISKVEEKAQNIVAKNLIFATSESGAVYIEKDLGNMQPEFYYRVYDSLKMLEAGTAKVKAFSGNLKLSKLCEVSPFQVRVIFRNLDSDTIFVMMARIKKDDNSVKDRKEPILRNQQVSLEYDKIKNEIKDPQRKVELIEENREIRDRLFMYLNKHSKG